MQRAFLLLFLASAASLLANDTSLHDGRFGPEPLDGRESPVRMAAEHIKVDFGYRYTDVHCTFIFRNTLKDRAVEQLVGFPDIGAAVDEMNRREPEFADVLGERVNTSRIRNLQTLVNGRPVKSQLRFGDARRGGNEEGTAVWSVKGKNGLRAWHTMRVNFPVGRDVTIERKYRVQNGASALGVAFFRYTTATGGVWKGAIGQLRADVTLRDGLTVDQLVWPGAKINGERLDGKFQEFATSPARKSWQTLDLRHLHLEWANFEPRTEPQHRGFSLSRPFHGWR
jgi:hypothetical protein